MSVVVVASIIPKPGRLQDLEDALAVSVPLVHEENGCELYAAHTDGEKVIMVERWSSPELLDAHSKGDALKKFGELIGDALAEPPIVTVLSALPLGDPIKGTIQ